MDAVVQLPERLLCGGAPAAGATRLGEAVKLGRKGTSDEGLKSVGRSLGVKDLGVSFQFEIP